MFFLLYVLWQYLYSIFFFFNDTATTEIYTLSLHDALPICEVELCDDVECRSPKPHTTLPLRSHMPVYQPPPPPPHPTAHPPKPPAHPPHVPLSSFYKKKKYTVKNYMTNLSTNPNPSHTESA